MRKKVWFLAGGVGLLAVASYASGFASNYIGHAPAMLTGMGAMVSCSQHFVSGIDQQQAQADLETYSPLFGAVNIEYDHTQKRVTARVFDEETSAQYREGQGCALEVGDTSTLDAIVLPVKGEALAEPWPKGGLTNPPTPAIQQMLEQLIAEDNEAGLQTRALLAVKNGEIVGEIYADGYDKNNKLIGWSMSKSFNAIMVGNMEMRGLIDPEQKPVFDEWATDTRSSISLDNMLHMASGLDLSEIYDPGTAVTSMLFTNHSASEIGFDVGLMYEPGTRFDYSSGTSNLLARLVFDAAGGSVQASYDNLHTQFVETMGLENFVLETDPSGVFLGSSFMMASARDWARMGQLMLDGGTLNGHQIVTEDWVERATSPNTTQNKKAYGYQFWLNSGDAKPRWPDLPADAYAALGSRDQVVMILPSEDMVIVRLGWNMDEQYPTSENFAKILVTAKEKP